MNKYRNATLVSNELVVTEAENNQDSVNQIPAFANGIAKLKANNAEIRDAMVNQKQTSSVYTEEKRIAHDELVGWIIDFIGGIHSYAVDKGDTVLKAKVNISDSEIKNMGFSEFITTANLISTLTKEIPTDELALHGISGSELNNYETALARFAEVKTSPQQAIIEHSKHTDTITKTQANSQELLKTLDKLASQFKRKAPAYYDIYFASRTNLAPSSGKKKDNGTDTTPQTTPTKE